MTRSFVLFSIVAMSVLSCSDDADEARLLADTQWRIVPPLKARLYYSFDSTGHSGTYAYLDDSCFVLQSVTVSNGKLHVGDEHYAYHLNSDPVSNLTVTYPVYYYGYNGKTDSITGYMDIIFEPTSLLLDTLLLCE